MMMLDCHLTGWCHASVGWHPVRSVRDEKEKGWMPHRSVFLATRKSSWGKLALSMTNCRVVG
jgi:hypothetical protein